MKKQIVCLCVITTLLLLIVTGYALISPRTQNVSINHERILKIWVSSYYMYEGDYKAPSDDWLITKQCREFEKKHDNVKIELSIIQNSENIGDIFRTAVTSGSGPDIVNLWTGQNLFNMKDILLDIKDYIPTRDKKYINGWESVTLDFKKGNPVLGYPACGSDVYGFLYNKQILSNIGIDLENSPPKNPEELLEMLIAIKNSGYLPIVADGADGNPLFSKAFGTWWVQMVETEHLTNLSRGAQKFSDDKIMIDCFTYLNKLFKMGLINKDYSTSQDALKRFISGEAAMLGGVNTSIITTILKSMDTNNVGFYTVPDYSPDAKIKKTTIGGISRTFSINRFTHYPDLCVDFCSFLSEKHNQLQYLELYPQLPIRRDISAFDLNWNKSEMMRKIFFLGQHYIYSIDNSLDTKISNRFSYLGTLAITGKITPEEMAKILDEKISEEKAVIK